MIGIKKRSLMMSALVFSATFTAGTVFAGEEPPVEILCHNIGGPRDLGANCDGTGTCTFAMPNSDQLITVPENYFFGILIGAGGGNAIAAHIAHGDGPAVVTFNPPLHLASVVGPHKVSNVECYAERVLPQPPEPGN